MATRRRPNPAEGFKRKANQLPLKYFGPEQRAPGEGNRRYDPARRVEEARLLRAARGGDAIALRRLLAHVSGPAFRYGMTFCRDREDAEEIAQDVLASLVRTLASYRGEGSLSTWAYTVARNACIRRRSRVAPPLESLDVLREERRLEPEDTASGPEERAELGELRAAVETAIRALPPALREAVILRDVEGLSARQAATVLRVGERAFKSRLHRARLALRDRLKPFVSASAAGANGSDGAAASASRRCPDIARYLSLHLEGDVDPDRCAKLEAHVRECPECAATCRSVRATLRACGALRAKPLPRTARAALQTALRGAVTSSAITR
ncbi:MAG TPA: sigma-70 family RNA polymerase sigma factor [Acidobacteriota bacterium]|nr:sigma-70 family RNA polymerase sigma factor [Acidobacteriota bacterium]